MTTGRTISDATFRAIEAIATWSPAALGERCLRFLWPSHLSFLQCLIRLVWLPFWAGTDLPAPQFRAKPAPFAGTSDAALRFDALLRTTRRRQLAIRFMTLGLRAVSLALIAGCAWTFLVLLDDASVMGRSLAAFASLLLVPALIFAWHYRPTTRDTARMIDRSFALSDRITTAYDVAAARPGSRQGSPNLAYLQVVEATNTLAMLDRHPTLKLRIPWREAVLVAGLAMIFLSLHLLNGTGTAIQPLAQSRVPAFVPASERFQQQAPIPDESALPELYKPTVAEVQERADLSAAAEHDLLQIADALEDNPLTRPIADAIRSGDYARAAELLKQLAPDLAQLSPEDRDAMASRLETAADAMSGEHPGLRQSTERAADGLRSTPEEAQGSLENLGDSIDATGDQVADQGELADQMREAREADRTGSVQDSSGTRPDGGDSESSGETTEGNPAGEGSDAAGGQEVDSSSQSSQSGTSSQSDGSNPDQQSDSESSEDGSSSGSESDATSRSGGSGSSASGESGTGEDSSSAGNGGGETEGPGNQLEGSSSGTSGDVESTGGSGAGSGEAENTRANGSDGAESRPGTGSGTTPDPDLADGSGSGTSTDSLGEQATGSTITLTRAPGTEGQRTGGSSSSSTGSGAGVAAGAGGTDQGDVGTAGPDSNRVPQEYRPIVEDYFSDGP